MKLTRRQILLGAPALMTGGCLLRKNPPPVIEHARYPLAAPPRPSRTAPGLMAGAAKIAITPPRDVWIAGYGFGRRMRGIRDPIYARALYLDDGERRIAIATADLVGLPLYSVDRIRRLLGPGIEVIVSSTHNHQSPDSIGFWGPAVLHAVPFRSGIDPAYQATLEKRIAGAIAKAALGAKPARVKLGRAEIPAGLVRNLRKPEEIDPAIEIVAAVGAGGESIATMVNYACHPETLGDQEHLISADYPGALCRNLEKLGLGLGLFASGALGGMVTSTVDKYEDYPTRDRYIERVGNDVSLLVRAKMERAQPIEISGLRVASKRVHLPIENSLFAMIDEIGLVEPRRNHARPDAPGTEVEVFRVDIGPARIATFPGEPTPRVGLRTKQRLGGEHPIVIGLANDEIGYILDPLEFDDPDDRYSYEKTVSFGPKTAPLLEEALASLVPA